MLKLVEVRSTPCAGVPPELSVVSSSVKLVLICASAVPLASSRARTISRGLQLGVTSLLEGSVRKAGDRVRITVQLINASDGYHLWSERYDRQMRDIFEIQDEIAQRVVAALRVALTPTERKALNKPKSREPEAYEYYLRGRRFFYRLTQKNLEFGRAMFERAIEIDPEYALAHCGLADCFSFLYLWYQQRPEYLQGAELASRRAGELSPDLAEAHASSGLVLSWCEECADQAERHFETALRLNPRLFEAYYFFARDCFARGRLEKAARLFERAAEVRPEDYQAALLLPQVYHALGRNEDSERAARRGLEIAERHEAMDRAGLRPRLRSRPSALQGPDGTALRPRPVANPRIPFPLAAPAAWRDPPGATSRRHGRRRCGRSRSRSIRSFFPWPGCPETRRGAFRGT